MKITLDIETNSPADLTALARISAALSGTEAPAAATPRPTPATKTKTESAVASTATAASSAEASPTAAGTQTSDSGQTATAAASPSDAVPSEADLIAAANVAVGKVGNGGPDKIKKYVAEKFQKADGSPGTLKLTAEPQRAKLLADLQAIGRGELTL